MKKQILVVCAVMMLVFCFSSTGVMALSDKCVELGFKWSDAADYDYVYAWVYADGAYASASGGVGTWEKFGGSFMMQYQTGCMPLYSGTKKQGYFQCTDGTGPTGPNYYTIKGTNKKDCEAAFAPTGSPTAREGRSDNSPE